MIDNLEELFRELRAQRKTLEQLLHAKQRQLAALHSHSITPAASPADIEAPKNVLALLSQSLDRIRLNRNAWLRLDPVKKQDHPEITELLRENQNLILKILVLDRESGPARRANGQVPGEPRATGAHFVARMYQRNSAS